MKLIAIIAILTTLLFAQEDSKDYQFDNDNSTKSSRYLLYGKNRGFYYANHNVNWYYSSINQKFSRFTEKQTIDTIK